MEITTNKKEFIETLFTPINGRTANGYIQRRGKRFIDFWIDGKEYTLNQWGVICSRSKLENGKTFYHHTLNDFGMGYSEGKDFWRQFAVGHDWNTKGEYRLIFN